MRDEMIEVGGVRMSAFELAFRSTVTKTIKSGKPRDLKAVIELLDKYGALPEADIYAEMKHGADTVMEKIGSIMARTMNRDPELEKKVDAWSREEKDLILACKSCSPELRRRWYSPERKVLAKDYYTTSLQAEALRREEEQ